MRIRSASPVCTVWVLTRPVKFHRVDSREVTGGIESSQKKVQNRLLRIHAEEWIIQVQYRVVLDLVDGH